MPNQGLTFVIMAFIVGFIFLGYLAASSDPSVMISADRYRQGMAYGSDFYHYSVPLN